MIFDAHAHLFSKAFFAGLWKQKHGGGGPSETELRGMIESAGLEAPPSDPAEHAARWVREMDSAGIDRMVVFTSLPGEQEVVAQAVRAFPERLVGYTMVNPKAPGAPDTARRDLQELGMKGIELFPAMHRFHPGDEDAVYPIYKLAEELGVPVFCHVGLLRVRLREILGLPSPFDISLGNPILLQRPAADFPKVRFIIPHLGCGFLREAAFLGYQCPNVFVDTSSSNAWLKLLPERADLTSALRLCLEAFGPDRILYGSDSSTLPRGYRRDVLESLQKSMEELGMSETDREKILGGNLAKILAD